MRHALVHWASLAWLGVALGCSRQVQPAYPASASLPYLPPRPELDVDVVRTEAEKSVGAEVYGLELSGPLAGAPAARGGGNLTVSEAAMRVVRGPGISAATHALLYGQAAPGSPAAAGLPGVDEHAIDPRHAAKIEREVQIAIAVGDVPRAAASVTALVDARKGWVAKDERTMTGAGGAQLLVRVPASDLDVFLAALSKLGEVKAQQIQVIDATLEHKDVEVVLDNLRQAQSRYRDLLAHATDPGQVLAIERELERVRTEIERLQARLDFLRDRVAFATVAIQLQGPAPVMDVNAGYQPHVSTGLRALTLIDVRDAGTNVYAGVGLGLRLPRALGDDGRGLALDIDLMRSCCGTNPQRSDWGYDVLTGLDLFSDSFEDGWRHWLNPFLGVRAGVASTQDRIDFAAAAVVGLEIIRTRALVIDAQARFLAMVGNPDGPHGGVEPSLGAALGF